MLKKILKKIHQKNCANLYSKLTGRILNYFTKNVLIFKIFINFNMLFFKNRLRKLFYLSKA